jgi:hypothetical protein
MGSIAACRASLPTSDPPPPAHYRVADLVESVNPEIVNQLLLRLIRSELGRHKKKWPLLVRLAARAYHLVPLRRRPKRLDTWLRSRVKTWSR